MWKARLGPYLFRYACAFDWSDVLLMVQLMSGIFFPKATAAFGALYMIGRQVYAIGYIKKGVSNLLKDIRESC
jgi:hypothetical protein